MKKAQVDKKGAVGVEVHAYDSDQVKDTNKKNQFPIQNSNL
jgi:hypothetical protein